MTILKYCQCADYRPTPLDLRRVHLGWVLGRCRSWYGLNSLTRLHLDVCDARQRDLIASSSQWTPPTSGPPFYPQPRRRCLHFGRHDEETCDGSWQATTFHRMTLSWSVLAGTTCWTGDIEKCATRCSGNLCRDPFVTDDQPFVGLQPPGYRRQLVQQPLPRATPAARQRLNAECSKPDGGSPEPQGTHLCEGGPLSPVNGLLYYFVYCVLLCILCITLCIVYYVVFYLILITMY